MPFDKKTSIDLIRKLSVAMPPLATDVSPRLTKLADIRMVAFDVYGTIVVSGCGDISTSHTGDDSSVMAASLRSAGVKLVGDNAGRMAMSKFYDLIAAMHEQMRGAGADCPEVEIRDVWRELLEWMVQEGTLFCKDRRQVDIDLLAIEFECRSNPVWPMPNAASTIDAIRRKGMKLGIVSNSQFYTPLMLEALFGQDLETLGFSPELCIWSYLHGIAKPSPRIYVALADALKRANILPQQTLYVGNDMLKDCRRAAALGFKTALFAGDGKSLLLRQGDLSCARFAPDAVITDLSQILDIVG